MSPIASPVSARPWLAILLAVVLLMLAGVACAPDGEGAADAGGDGTNLEVAGGEGAADAGDDADGAEAEAGAGEGGAADAGDDGDDGEEPVGMIASGTAVAPPAPALPERPTQAGVTRMVSVAEARGQLPFPIYEPAFTPDDTNLDVTMLVTPRGDAPEPGLPALRHIYTVASTSTFLLYQSPAGDRPFPEGAESSTVAVGDTEATVVRDGLTHTLVWERGETRIELSSRDLPVETLAEIAASLQPVE